MSKGEKKTRPARQEDKSPCVLLDSQMLIRVDDGVAPKDSI